MLTAFKMCLQAGLRQKCLMLIQLLLKVGVDPNSATNLGETTLMTVARTGNVDAAKVLLDAGAKVDAREQWHDETALMWAAAEKHADVAKALIAGGAAAGFALGAPAVRAQSFPTRPIRYICPWPAGGSTGATIALSSPRRRSQSRTSAANLWNGTCAPPFVGRTVRLRSCSTETRFAGGAMIFLVMSELLPESLESCSRTETAWGVTLGLVGMLGFTAALGL